jgi:hypothetical protein
MEYPLPQLVSSICEEFHVLPYGMFRNALAQELGRRLLHFCRQQSLDPLLKPELEQACNALDALLKQGALDDEGNRQDLAKLRDLGRRALSLYGR